MEDTNNKDNTGTSTGNPSGDVGPQGVDITTNNQSSVNEESFKNGEKTKPTLFQKGNPGGPGRPKGSISIKTRIKQKFEENPELFEKYLDELIEKEKALTWQMLEGRPAQTIAGDKENPLRIIALDKELADIYGIPTSKPENNSEGQN